MVIVGLLLLTQMHEAGLWLLFFVSLSCQAFDTALKLFFYRPPKEGKVEKRGRPKKKQESENEEDEEEEKKDDDDEKKDDDDEEEEDEWSTNLMNSLNP